MIHIGTYRDKYTLCMCYCPLQIQSHNYIHHHCNSQSHNNQDRQKCTKQCWLHHCIHHFQLKDEFQQDTFQIDGTWQMCNLNNSMYLEMINNNLHHHNCSPEYWLHHYKSHFQVSQGMDKLKFETEFKFEIEITLILKI